MVGTSVASRGACQQGSRRTVQCASPSHSTASPPIRRRRTCAPRAKRAVIDSREGLARELTPPPLQLEFALSTPQCRGHLPFEELFTFLLIESPLEKVLVLVFVLVCRSTSTSFGDKYARAHLCGVRACLGVPLGTSGGC